MSGKIILLDHEWANVYFWPRVQKTDTCWLWTASITSRGYGQCFFHQKVSTTHRVSYILNYGCIPDNLHVCHHCDVRHCVRPDHLFLGTNKDNLQDASQKNRISRTHQKRGSDHPLSKLTNTDVMEIRDLSSRMTQSEIARLYNVRQNTIFCILSGQTWSWLK